LFRIGRKTKNFPRKLGVAASVKPWERTANLGRYLAHMDSYEPYQPDAEPKLNEAYYVPEAAKPPRDRYWLHILLFLLTLVTTCMAGAVLITNRHWFDWEGSPDSPLLQWTDLAAGLPYALSFLTFLTVHEFGHYFTALYYRVRTSLPYYIPIYLPFAMLNIGSFGAVIRLRQVPSSNLKYFDIGIAGPLAGFVVSFGLLWYGFTHLPPLEYLFQMNPSYPELFGGIPSEEEIIRKYGGGLAIGTSLLFEFFRNYVADPALLPNRFEIIHYPYLFVGFITLFFTALNLLPIGQLDGGHVTYGLFGRVRAGLISRAFVLMLMLYGGLGLVDLKEEAWFFNLSVYLLYLFFLLGRILGLGATVYHRLMAIAIILGLQQSIQLVWPSSEFNFLWLFYAFMAVRVIRLDHPPALVERPLDWRRKALGWLALGIFVISFSPEPLQLVTKPTRLKKDKESVFTQAPAKHLHSQSLTPR
jgi:membrane-associated protease RseP (regulator of RpoE activity)